jgi:hypothetical protein
MLIVSVESQCRGTMHIHNKSFEPTVDMNINQGKSILSVLGDDMEGTHCDIYVILVTEAVVTGSENNQQRQKHRSSHCQGISCNSRKIQGVVVHACCINVFPG